MTKKKEVQHKFGDASHPAKVEFNPRPENVLRPPENVLRSNVGEPKLHTSWARLQAIGAFASIIGGAITWQLNLQGIAIGLFIIGGVGALSYLPVIVVKPSEFNDDTKPE